MRSATVDPLRDEDIAMPNDQAVCVAFTPDREYQPTFIERLRRDTLTAPGCHAFDAWTDEARPIDVLL